MKVIMKLTLVVGALLTANVVLAQSSLKKIAKLETSEKVTISEDKVADENAATNTGIAKPTEMKAATAEPTKIETVAPAKEATQNKSNAKPAKVTGAKKIKFQEAAKPATSNSREK